MLIIFLKTILLSVLTIKFFNIPELQIKNIVVNKLKNIVVQCVGFNKRLLLEKKQLNEDVLLYKILEYGFVVMGTWHKVL